MTGGIGVKVTVFDLAGREVAVLVNKPLSVGTYEITWQPTNLSSGMYLYRMQAGSFTQTRKMLLLK